MNLILKEKSEALKILCLKNLWNKYILNIQIENFSPTPILKEMVDWIVQAEEIRVQIEECRQMNRELGNNK